MPAPTTQPCAAPLHFATTNRDKLREAEQILGRPVTGVALALEELQTTDLAALARHKAQQAHAALGRPVLVEDTGLVFLAWGALPGPFIKFFLEHLGLEGLVRALGPFADKRAEAVCTVGYHDGSTVQIFSGRTPGRIVPPAGEGGFGWDPIFVPDGQPGGGARTFAQLDAAEKHACSMRARALQALAAWLA
jgi:non-canonical purine NTP pyrophosphatase (RdgB/HAM1 family)